MKSRKKRVAKLTPKQRAQLCRKAAVTLRRLIASCNGLAGPYHPECTRGPDYKPETFQPLPTKDPSYDRLREKYATAFEALAHIAGGSTNPQGLASDAMQRCIDVP